VNARRQERVNPTRRTPVAPSPVYPTIILCSYTAIYTILLQNLSGDPIEMVLEFFQAFSSASAPLAPRQYLENFGATFGAFWTGRALVYNFRKTVLIFALNRYYFGITNLITGNSMGEGIIRFRIVSDSMCKPTPELVSTFRRFTVFSRFFLSGSHLNRLL